MTAGSRSPTAAATISGNNEVMIEVMSPVKNADENDAAESSEKQVLDQRDAAAPGRYNFYNAAEVYQASSEEEAKRTVQQLQHHLQDDKEQKRFNFYDPEEVYKSAPLHFPKPIDLSQLTSNTKTDIDKNTENVDKNMEMPTSPSSTGDILRNLQETERERENLRVGGRNPYEAAIHDALHMLRHKGGGDKILESRQATYSDFRLEKERAREERMAKYAAKLVDRQAAPTGTSPEETSANLSPLPPVNKDKVEKLLQARVEDHQSVDSRDNTSVLSLEPEELQEGIERILMAILDRARRGEGDNGLTDALNALLVPETQPEPSRRVGKPPSRRLAEEYLTDDEDDDSINDERDIRQQQSQASSQNKRSVVDELLAEDEQLPTSPTSTFPKNTGDMEAPEHISGTEEDGDGEDDDEHDEGEEDDEGEDGYADESEDEHDLEEDADDSILPQDTSLTQVLGPLGGPETGVVLENSDTVHDDDEDDPTASDAPSSILESIAKDAESFMSFMTGGSRGGPIVADQAPAAKKDVHKDKYSSQDDISLDGEANELMRSLCAHLLPFGVDKSTKHLSEIPPWDDTNANEPGYRIIRLSKTQLHRVEGEFERMVNGVKRSSELNLSRKGNMTALDASKDWNGVGTDDQFKKDLEEAEDLLDRDEMQREAEGKAKSALDHSSVDSQSEEEEESKDEPAVDNDDDIVTVSCHPEFPGVQMSGRGEMGDLEYFNLPIIYKSHVTGFEPTKDLYLEPGNVVAGQYLVENEIGSAAFSTAYRCIDLNSDATGNGEYHDEVCLKVIKNTKDFFDQSLDEIKILELLRQTGKCSENNIVEMKTFFYHREHLIIVTELLRQNLFEFGKFIIDNNEEPYFTLQRLCYLTRQVLVALSFVHALSLVHSDVKPENILLSSYSRAKVKLIDFGSSCYLTDRQSSYIQSRSYRAPEVVLGLPYDGKIDIWSLGCVVAEMFTGEVTFQNDSVVSMLSRIEAICGPFPRHMIAQGRQSNRFFTKSGLLYEIVESDSHEAHDTGLFDVFQPKRTTLATRLGFDPKAIQQAATPEEQTQALFVDFVQSLLTIDPDSRPTAAEALQHPWIISGESLTEEDIKYPSH